VGEFRSHIRERTDATPLREKLTSNAVLHRHQWTACSIFCIGLHTVHRARNTSVHRPLTRRKTTSIPNTSKLTYDVDVTCIILSTELWCKLVYFQSETIKICLSGLSEYRWQSYRKESTSSEHHDINKLFLMYKMCNMPFIWTELTRMLSYIEAFSRADACSLMCAVGQIRSPQQTSLTLASIPSGVGNLLRLMLSLPF